MSSVHAYALLKADVDRCLAPWRDRQAAAARAERQPKVRELTILTAVVQAMRQVPDEWDTELRTAFQQDCRQAVAAEYHAGMDQNDANAVAQDVLNEWLDEDDNELEDTDDVDDDPDDSDFDDDDADEEEDYEDDDGDGW
jgi:TATA-binding protein-associated factor Taf7